MIKWLNKWLKAMDRGIIFLSLLYESQGTKIFAIANELPGFISLLHMCRKIFEDPQNAMKEFLNERKTAPKEYESIYDTLVMLCKLKMIAEKRNISVTELVNKVLQDYVSANWEDDQAQ